MYFQLTTTGAVEESLRTMRQFLAAYQKRQAGFDFEVNDLDWNDAWNELVRVAISKTGADVSEIGAPWVSDFVAMNSLRRFTGAEVEAVGGAGAFFPMPWRNVMISPSSLATSASADTPSAPGVYALPGRVDVRVIYFWKDMLEKASIDAATAFTTPTQLEQTLERLRTSGIANPWVYQTHATRNWVYNMASWIWAYGGDFMDEFGQPSFDQPEAIDGITAYFRLHRYLEPTESGEPIEWAFSKRRTAVMVLATYYSIYLLQGIERFGTTNLLPMLGMAQAPGPSFVGGTSFVIWQHTPYKISRAAIDLLTRLQTSPYLPEYCYRTQMLPSRLDGFNHPEVAADPFLPVMRAALETGRANRSGRLWMPIADRLSTLCRILSSELRQNPGQDVRALVEPRVHRLAERLRMGRT